MIYEFWNRPKQKLGYFLGEKNEGVNFPLLDTKDKICWNEIIISLT